MMNPTGKEGRREERGGEGGGEGRMRKKQVVAVAIGAMNVWLLFDQRNRRLGGRRGQTKKAAGEERSCFAALSDRRPSR